MAKVWSTLFILACSACIGFFYWLYLDDEGAADSIKMESKSMDSHIARPDINAEDPAKSLAPPKTSSIQKTNSQKSHKKPKIAIVIDDLATPKDIQAFNSIGLKINLSLLPKHKFSIHNPKEAKKLDFYMVHLPLEANSFSQKGVKELKVGDSMEEVQAYIDEIKSHFPSLKYINNHTGSRYTASREDMEKLLKALDKHEIIFVDSRTSSSTVVKELYEERGQVYLHRQVFLDNEDKEEVVIKSLEKALKIANKQGFVIAIGHPRKSTLEILKRYKQKLEMDYELVYISELDEFLTKNK